jgi:hypothetical protein
MVLCWGPRLTVAAPALLLQQAVSNAPPGRLLYEKGEKEIVRTHGIPVHCGNAKSRGSSTSASLWSFQKFGLWLTLDRLEK